MDCFCYISHYLQIWMDVFDFSPKEKGGLFGSSQGVVVSLNLYQLMHTLIDVLKVLQRKSSEHSPETPVKRIKLCL